MRYYRTTTTVLADGEVYGVFMSRQSAADGRQPPIPPGSRDVVANCGRKWLMGTFRPDGTPMGAVFRDYDSERMPCCMCARWDGYKCEHMTKGA